MPTVAPTVTPTAATADEPLPPPRTGAIAEQRDEDEAKDATANGSSGLSPLMGAVIAVGVVVALATLAALVFVFSTKRGAAMRRQMMSGSGKRSSPHKVKWDDERGGDGGDRRHDGGRQGDNRNRSVRPRLDSSDTEEAWTDRSESMSPTDFPSKLKNGGRPSLIIVDDSMRNGYGEEKHEERGRWNDDRRGDRNNGGSGSKDKENKWAGFLSRDKENNNSDSSGSGSGHAHLPVMSPRKQKILLAHEKEDKKKRDALVNILAERIVESELHSVPDTDPKPDASNVDSMIEVHARRLSKMPDARLLDLAAAMSPSEKGAKKPGSFGRAGSAASSSGSIGSKTPGSNGNTPGSAGGTDDVPGSNGNTLSVATRASEKWGRVRRATFSTPAEATEPASPYVASQSTPIALTDLNLELSSRHHKHTFEDEATVFRKKMEAFYEEHVPGKTQHIDTIVLSPKYEGVHPKGGDANARVDTKGHFTVERKRAVQDALEAKYGKEIVSSSFKKFDDQQTKEENAEKFEILQACMMIEKMHQKELHEKQRKQENEDRAHQKEQQQQEAWYGEMRREAEEKDVLRRAKLRRPSRSAFSFEKNVEAIPDLKKQLQSNKNAQAPGMRAPTGGGSPRGGDKRSGTPRREGGDKRNGTPRRDGSGDRRAGTPRR
jgi:hypothetical protein